MKKKKTIRAILEKLAKDLEDSDFNLLLINDALAKIVALINEDELEHQIKRAFVLYRDARHIDSDFSDIAKSLMAWWEEN